MTLASHGFVDGQQVTFSGGDYAVDSVTVSADTVYCVKNTTDNTFELLNREEFNEKVKLIKKQFLGYQFLKPLSQQR